MDPRFDEMQDAIKKLEERIAVLEQVAPKKPGAVANTPPRAGAAPPTTTRASGGSR